MGIILLSVLFFFRLGIFNSLSFVSHKIFYSVLVPGNAIVDKFQSISSYFTSKNSLYLENENLRLRISENRALMLNYDSLLAENVNLKEILGRKDEKISIILATILKKPNQSPYDTVVVDVGENKKVEKGDTVFALSYNLAGDAVKSVPIGKVSDVYSNSSKVILFSTGGEKTQVIVGEQSVFMEVVGRGGGNFEMILPRDFILQKGDQAVLPGITPRIIGIVETIISDPRDSFKKALLVSPVNIQELKFLVIETK